ncbi:MAG: phosphate uptake regulator PhoU [Nanoarchaeota archaeon]|nr:phosphate uptake regulator PhoU [Nanoarchaeota archaeon]
MEKPNYRKVIQLGKTTSCVSLPKAWLEKYGIEKGDTILLDIKPNGTLIITPKIKSQTYEAEITINTKGKSLEEVKRNIIAAYINNYTRINIIGDNIAKSLTSFSRISELLTATEIMGVENDKIVIKAFFDANSASIKHVITRLNMMIRSLFTHIKNILLNDEKNYEFLKRENEINRICFMGFRILSHTSGNFSKIYLQGKDEIDVLSTWMMLDKLEKIADRLYGIGSILKNSKNLENAGNQCKKNIANLVSNVENVYKTAILSFYNNDRAAAHKIIGLCQKNSKLCNNKQVKYNNKHIVLLSEKLDRVNTIAKHIGMIVIDKQPID